MSLARWRAICAVGFGRRYDKIAPALKFLSQPLRFSVSKATTHAQQSVICNNPSSFLYLICKLYTKAARGIDKRTARLWPKPETEKKLNPCCGAIDFVSRRKKASHPKFLCRLSSLPAARLRHRIAAINPKPWTQPYVTTCHSSTEVNYAALSGYAAEMLSGAQFRTLKGSKYSF